MKLSDLSLAQAKILRSLAKNGPCVRSVIVQDLADQIPNGTISSCLNRLEAMGFVERPEVAGGEWGINPKGAALLAPPPAASRSEIAADLVESEGTGEPETLTPEPETLTPEPEALPPESEPNPPKSRDLKKEPGPDAIASFLVEDALWEVKTRLAGDWEIPPLTRRVYAEVLDCLPAPLQAALQPLTEYLRTMR